MNLEIITATDIDAAAAESDLNAALVGIMKKAGIESSDVAGVYFNGTILDGEIDVADAWPTESHADRVEHVRAWLHLETIYQAEADR